MQTISRIDGPIRPTKKWTKIPFILKYDSYIQFGMFWFGLGLFWILIGISLTSNNQSSRYSCLLASILWVRNIYKSSKYANLHRARREYMRWLVIERLENEFCQYIFEIIAFFIILTKGSKNHERRN